MADGKWISDLTAATSVADAARRVLAVRLEVIRDYLPRALREPDKDPEHVHQLRVGTRRAGAALKIFRSCLPSRAYRRARRRLRGLRRAAGAARDWDVFLGELGRWENDNKERRQPGIDFLIGYVLAQRVAAQEHLERAAPRRPFAFDRLLAETAAAVRKPSESGAPQALVDLARPMLAGLLGELEQAAAGDLDDYDHLHRVRILGKRLRYAMEVFADCFPPEFRETIYPAVEEMQEVLGLANDSHVAGQRLEALRDRVRSLRPADFRRFRPVLEGLLRFHHQRLPEQRRLFLEWRQRWQESGTGAALAALLRAPEPTLS